MIVGEIITNYGLEQDIAKYLSKVDKSKDWREYEKHKRVLGSLCSSDSRLFGRAMDCLIEIMRS